MTNPNTPTPRTDAAVFQARERGTPLIIDLVNASFARELERDLTAAAQRLEELEKDKARLDWLFSEAGPGIRNATTDELFEDRAAIDAARTTQPSTEGGR